MRPLWDALKAFFRRPPRCLMVDASKCVPLCEWRDRRQCYHQESKCHEDEISQEADSSTNLPRRFHRHSICFSLDRSGSAAPRVRGHIQQSRRSRNRRAERADHRRSVQRRRHVAAEVEHERIYHPARFDDGRTRHARELAAQLGRYRPIDDCSAQTLSLYTMKKTWFLQYR